MTNPTPTTPVLFSVASVKKTPQRRADCGTGIGAHAPNSTLYQDPEVKPAVDNVTKRTGELSSALNDFTKARLGYIKARAALIQVVGNWDTEFDVLVSVATKHCSTQADAAALGMPLREPASHELQVPISVTVKQDFKTRVLRIRVKRAPGMRTTVIQVSRDPVTATSWEELPGDGVLRDVENPAPGVWYVRAAHKTARDTSAFTDPVSIVIK